MSARPTGRDGLWQDRARPAADFLERLDDAGQAGNPLVAPGTGSRVPGGRAAARRGQNQSRRPSQSRPGADVSRSGRHRPGRSSGGDSTRRGGNSSLYRNGLALVLSSGLSAVLGAGFWVFAAHSTPREALGEATALVSAMMGLSMIGRLNLGSALGAFLPVAGNRRVAFTATSYIVAAAVSAVLGLVFAVIAPRASGSFGSVAGPKTALLFGLCVAVWSLFAMQDSVLAGVRRATWVPLENTVYNIIKFAVAAALGGGSVLVLMASWVVPAALAVALVSYVLFSRILPSRETPAPGADNRSFWRYTASESVAMTLDQIAVSLLPVLVVSTLGARVGAAFGLAWMITSAFDQLAIGLGSSLVVEGSQLGADVHGMYRALRRRCLLALGGVVVVAEIGAPVLLRVFGAEYADDATAIFRLLTLASLPRALLLLAMCAARAERKMGRVVRTHIALAVLIPGGAILLGHAFGLVGVGLAWAGAQLLVALGVLVNEMCRPAGAQAAGPHVPGPAVDAATTMVIIRPNPLAAPILPDHSSLLDTQLTMIIPRLSRRSTDATVEWGRRSTRGRPL